MSTRLWYNRVKEDWMDALPLGNGRLAAMFFGMPSVERIEINEESLWSGKRLEERYNIEPGAMDRVRKLIFSEQYEEAAECAKRNFLASPARVRFYESFGNIFIDFYDKSEAEDYYKYLELSEAVAGAAYTKNGIKYNTECFMSEKYDVLVYRVKADNYFDCTLSVKRDKDEKIAVKNGDMLVMTGRVSFPESPEYGEAGEGVGFASVIRVKTDGIVSEKDNSLKLENATYIEVYGAFETNYAANKFDVDEAVDAVGVAFDKCNNAVSSSYDIIKAEHIKCHSELFGNVSFELKSEDKSFLPTDERLLRVQNGEADLDLVTLYYNFGRYLLLESSAKNAALPANLQGKWSTGFTPPWGSDYHTNINIQMNYWHCHSANLETAFPAFLNFVKKLAEFGRATAQKLYNARGWTVHHTTDIFGRCGVHDGVEWGFFPMAGPWLSVNLWEHFEYTNDIEYLREIYPILKSSCEFVTDFLVESPDGYLVTNPSNSPENSFYYYDKDGGRKTSMFTYGATMDFEIIECLFSRMIAACKIQNKDREFAKELENIKKRLPPLKISERYGTIREWIKDYEETEPAHRHISHLFALFPGDSINENRPELFEGAEKTIHRRISHGGGATGWSRAWIINFYARLKDGNAAWENIKLLLQNSTAYNLFDMHPPFQIDGNFGAVSGITEMLAGSHLGKIGERITTILPALPDEWTCGRINGIKVRGNFELDILWKDNKLLRLGIKSLSDNIFRLKLDGGMSIFNTKKQYRISDNVLMLDFAGNEFAEILFGEDVNND